MFFTGVFGNKIYNGSRAHYTAPDFFTGGKNVLKEFTTTVPPPTPIPTCPLTASSRTAATSGCRASRWVIRSTHFNDWIQSAQLYVTCNNVFTITGYKGLDPEVTSVASTPV